MFVPPEHVFSSSRSFTISVNAAVYSRDQHPAEQHCGTLLLLLLLLPLGCGSSYGQQEAVLACETSGAPGPLTGQNRAAGPQNNRVAVATKGQNRPGCKHTGWISISILISGEFKSIFLSCK